jgi:hypothetical protein
MSKQLINALVMIWITFAIVFIGVVVITMIAARLT